MVNYATSFRVKGEMAALLGSVITVCRQDQCYSQSLNELLRGSRYGRKLVFPEPTSSHPAPRITVGLGRLEDCRVWCDMWVTFRCTTDDIAAACAPDEVTHDGDVYEVSIRRAGHAKRNSLCDIAQYRGPAVCGFYESDHSNDPPWTLE
jgi:hypothetical protein